MEIKGWIELHILSYDDLGKEESEEREKLINLGLLKEDENLDDVTSFKKELVNINNIISIACNVSSEGNTIIHLTNNMVEVKETPNEIFIKLLNNNKL